MNIYLISGKDDYEHIDCAVVIAKDEGQARIIRPPHEYSYHWPDDEDIRVKLIGETNEKEAKVICASFSQG